MLDNIRNMAQSFAVKLIFGIIIIVFVFWGVGNMGGSSSGSLAVVNGEKITVNEYVKEWEAVAREERKKDPAVFENADTVKRYKHMVLNDLVVLRLLQQEAKRLGIIVTPHELKVVVDTYSAFQDENGKFDPVRYRQTVASLNLTEGEFENDLSQGILRNKVIRYLGMSAGISPKELRRIYDFRLEKRPVEYVLFASQEYAENAEVDEAEISDYYAANKEQFRLPVRAAAEYLILTPDSIAGQYPVGDEAINEYYNARRVEYHRLASFQIRNIFILSPSDDLKDPGADEARAKGKEKLEAVLEGIKQGKDFADLARQYSDDKYSSDIGGMLGWINEGESGAPEVEAMAFSLKPGEIGKPVHHDQGWFIIKLEDKKEGRDLPLAEVRDEIIHELGRKKAEAEFAGVQEKAEKWLAEGEDSLEDFGAGFNIKVSRTDLVPQAELVRKIDVQKDSLQMLTDAVAAVAAGAEASTIPVPLGVENGIAIVRITAARDSEIPSLADMAESVNSILKYEKGRKLALAAAEAALPAFEGQGVPAALADKVVKSGQPALRISPSLDSLGPAAELVEALFSSPEGTWLPRVYEVATGAVIARATAVEPVTDDQWNANGMNFVDNYRRYWAGQAVRVFLKTLHDNAKVEVSEDMLDRMDIR